MSRIPNTEGNGTEGKVETKRRVGRDKDKIERKAGKEKTQRDEEGEQGERKIKGRGRRKEEE
jgi:hypothetical protein